MPSDDTTCPTCGHAHPQAVGAFAAARVVAALDNLEAVLAEREGGD